MFPNYLSKWKRGNARSCEGLTHSMAAQCKLVLISEQCISAWHLFLPSVLGCLSSQAGLFCFISPSWKLILFYISV